MTFPYCGEVDAPKQVVFECLICHKTKESVIQDLNMKRMDLND